MHKLLLDHFNSCHPISSRQCGFMAGRSTTSALFTVTHDILNSIDDGEEVCTVFFDLKKAFDSVSHRQLITHNADVCPYIVQWLHGYLLKRMQFVVVGWWRTISCSTSLVRCPTRVSARSPAFLNIH